MVMVVLYQTVLRAFEFGIRIQDMTYIHSLGTFWYIVISGE